MNKSKIYLGVFLILVGSVFILQNMGFKIIPSAGTGKIDDNNDYKSENYSTAETAIILTLDIGTGAVYVDSQEN